MRSGTLGILNICGIGSGNVRDTGNPSNYRLIAFEFNKSAKTVTPYLVTLSYSSNYENGIFLTKNYVIRHEYDIANNAQLECAYKYDFSTHTLVEIQRNNYGSGYFDPNSPRRLLFFLCLWFLLIAFI